MTGITALFWDLGGVVLSNGWDRDSRIQASKTFVMDDAEFERRHTEVVDAFETGRMTLPDYLQHTVFYQPRPFTEQQFTDFLFALSVEKADTRAVLDEASATGRYLLATINNESLELNEYRIREFGLARNFAVFFSSCYMRARKPDETIYRMALSITQRSPEECVFIDDREVNIEAARRLGMRAILFRNAVQLRADLSKELHHGIA